MWDYTTAFEDVRARTLRLIGDPETRYREDPVRMLRAMRFAAKLDFELAPETAAPIAELGRLLRDVPPARLFDELLEAVSKRPRRQELREAAAIRSAAVLVPRHERAARYPEPRRDASRSSAAGLRNTDERIRDDKPITPMFLYAVFLWFPIQELAARLCRKAGAKDKRYSKRVIASSPSSRRCSHGGSARR